MKALVYHGPGRPSLGRRPRPGDRGSDRHRHAGRRRHDLWHRPAHPQGGRAGGRAGDDPRPRGGRHGRRDRRRSHDPSPGRPRPRVLHHVLRPVPVLPRGSLRALHGRGRLDPGSSDRRCPGRVRPHPLRRHVRVQDPSRAHGRAGALPGGHPADLLRGRRARRRSSGPGTRSRSSAPGRSASPRS